MSQHRDPGASVGVPLPRLLPAAEPVVLVPTAALSGAGKLYIAQDFL
jgi:hypothetical protein